MKKVLISAVAGIALLAGCSSGGGNSPSEEAADPGLSAEISYGFWDESQRPAMEQIIEDFNKEYPNIKVSTQITPYANYFTKLQTQGSSGTLPDVFWMNGPNFQLYASNDLLAPMADGVDPKNYPQALNDLYSYDGKQYGVPKDFDTIGVFYNKAVFDKAGVEYPTDDWTWEEFHTKAKAVSDALSGEGIYGVANGLDGQSYYYNTMLQAGGEMISEDGTKSGFDSPESIAGLQLVADLIADGSSPTQSQLSDTAGDQWFLNGKSAMYWTGTWSNAQLLASPIKDTIALAPLPQGERKATVIHGLANVVASGSSQMAAAQAFQAYLGSEEAALTQATTGAANPAFTGTQDSWVASAPWDLQIFLTAAEEYSYPYPVSLDTAKWNKVEQDLLPDAFSGARPVKEVAEEIAARMNEILDAEQ